MKHNLLAKLVAAVGAGFGLAGAATFWQNRRRVQPSSLAKLTKDNWRAVAKGTFRALGKKNIPILGAGVAYFSTLSFFPLMAAAVSIAAIVIAPEQIQQVTARLADYLPGDIAGLITAQLTNLSGDTGGSIIAAVIAIALSLFGASGAIKNMMTATNAIYECRESRGFIAVQVVGLLFTLGAITVGFLMIGLLILNSSILAFLHIPSLAIGLLLGARWVVIVVIIVAALAIFYRFGPSRPGAHWQWVSPGAVLATIVWLIGTIAFFIYVQYFAGFSQAYSLFAGIIVLMTWLNLSAFIVLLGAQVNRSLETQTGKQAPKAKK